jgi:hypothetical protein
VAHHCLRLAVAVVQGKALAVLVVQALAVLALLVRRWERQPALIPQAVVAVQATTEQRFAMVVTAVRELFTLGGRFRRGTFCKSIKQRCR